MEEITTKFNSFMELYPHYGYLIATLGFALFLLGYIKNWNWVMEPGGGWMNIAYWENKIGNKAVRIVMGTVCSFGMLSTLSLFIYYEFYA